MSIVDIQLDTVFKLVEENNINLEVIMCVCVCACIHMCIISYMCIIYVMY